MLTREELDRFKELCNFTWGTSSSPKSEIQRLGLRAVEDILKYRTVLKDALFRLEKINLDALSIECWELDSPDIQDIIHNIERVLHIKNPRSESK